MALYLALQNGMTALLFVIVKGKHLHMVPILLDAGADPNAEVTVGYCRLL